MTSEWKASADWATPIEEHLRQRVLLARTAFEKAQAYHAASLAELDDALAGARVHGDAYERAMLTAEGPDLVVVVARALTELGFVVGPVPDEVDDDQRARLRITDPSQPGWYAITEVNGFCERAADEDLIDLRRYATQNARNATTSGPLWFVVNHCAAQDPATRPPALADREDLVAGFAEAGGTIIDTRELFALLREARRHPERRSTIRVELASRTGRVAALAGGE